MDSGACWRPARFQEDDDDVEVGDDGDKSNGRCFESGERSSRLCAAEKTCRVMSRVFSEELEAVMSAGDAAVLDPRGRILHLWNKVFLAACLASLFVDPLFLYLPTAAAPPATSIAVDVPALLALTVVRSVLDIFYAAQIILRFRTAFVAPSSRVFGRGELVINPAKIALHYLSRSFPFDLIAALPLPQLVVWVQHSSATTSSTDNLLRFTIIVQYIPRLLLIFPLSRRIILTTGALTETAWAGAAYNLLLYMLASHVLGALWYLLSVGRLSACWRAAGGGNITAMCTPESGFYQFGIYAEALSTKLTTAPFMDKYCYGFWWGLKNLSCLGQNLGTSTILSEIGFAVVIAVLGLVLFGLLIGNVQSYLQATTVRLEEWRAKRADTERWMRHRQLPLRLRRSVRRHHQYRWVATCGGVEEEALLQDLPVDLRREIKRHLCLDLVRRVPLFDAMDERLLEAICERLRPALFTGGVRLVRELDAVDEMLFIIRGFLDSSTTQGGRSDFFDSCRIGPGEFCGEELLPWALDPRAAAPLPMSTRTVRAVTEVEAFALGADELKLVASQFRRLHSRQMRHTFRFYSHQWRTWAACFIQAAWRRQRRRRASMELRTAEEAERCRRASAEFARRQMVCAGSVFGDGAYRRRVSALTAWRRDGGGGGGEQLKKPPEPDFCIDEELR